MWILLFIILPTILSFLLLDKIKIIKNPFLLVSLSWFFGQYFSTFLIFILAMFLSLITQSVLIKSTILYLVIICGFVIFLNKKILNLIKSTGLSLSFSSVSKEILLILSCFLISYFIYKPHLAYKANKIYTSPVYWDFNIHFPIIQNFVFGDNFPPESESFAGTPMTYHYFFDLYTSIYSVLGLGIVNSITFVSIMAFFFMLLSLIGLAKEYFDSPYIGLIAVLLTITSGSLRFIYDLQGVNINNVWLLVKNTINNNQHPFFFSFIEKNPFGYNGTMFNIFYFVAERHLLFAIVFLIFYLSIVFHRDRMSDISNLIFGLSLGLFFQWHLFISVSIGLSIFFLLIFSKKRRGILLICIGYYLVAFSYFLIFKTILKNDWFLPDINNYPKINFNFPTFLPDYSFSIYRAFCYYLFAYGIKIPLFMIASYYLFNRKRKILMIILSIIIPTFVLINTVQLSPLSIYDNHKWLKPMNVFIDLITSVVVYVLLKRKKLYYKILGLAFLIILILSGLIELIPFIKSRPTNLYAFYPTELITAVREKSSPKSIFLSFGSKELHLAGRKLFLGSSQDEPGATSVLIYNKYNISKREEIIKSIYLSASLTAFCNLTKENNIDFVELNESMATLPLYPLISQNPHIKTRNEYGNLIYYIKTSRLCTPNNVLK